MCTDIIFEARAFVSPWKWRLITSKQSSKLQVIESAFKNENALEISLSF